jgi:acyl phosphate:glycerol-3-phosphate acyltransferase
MIDSIGSISLISILLSIAIAYLLGSISSANIVGRLAGNIDMRNEPDGRISASAIYCRMGVVPFAIVIIMDVCFAAGAVVIARMLTNSLLITIFSGIATVAGHNWSVYQKFKGGLGATAILGALAVILTWQILYGLAVGGIVLFITHRPGLSTTIAIFGISGTILIQNGIGLLAAYPLMLYILMVIKKLQVARLTSPINLENPNPNKQ